jgi:hypothetical protein
MPRGRTDILPARIWIEARDGNSGEETAVRFTSLGLVDRTQGSSSFLKKNQKTFAPCSTPDGCSRLPSCGARRQKFFVSFFQKRNASFTLLPL